MARMHGSRALLALLGAALALTACGASRTTKPERDRNLITADEIATVEATTAYDVVTRLRSEFLRSRGPVSATMGRATQRPAVTVFLDGVEAGPAEQALRQIPAAHVREIRLYRAGDAATKYGSRHAGGVIEVRTTRPER